MKIVLTKSTFYFNDPINLTPLVRSLDVSLSNLDDSVVRKLNLGVLSGVIEITDGIEEFNLRIATINKTRQEKKAPVVQETVVKAVLEEPVKEEVPEVTEPVKEVVTPVAKKTVTKKTTTKKV